MARRTRAWFPGAIYHLTGRGVRQQELFIDDEDRKKYLNFLLEAIKRYPCNIFSYCLMGNHLHLLLKTLETPPGKIIGYVHSNYAKEFNRKYGFTGHVFEKRYFHDMIETRGHDLTVSNYIHLNPLKAGIVTKLEDYQWSSYRAYFCDAPDPIVTKDPILTYFPEPKVENYHNSMMRQYKANLDREN